MASVLPGKLSRLCLKLFWERARIANIGASDDISTDLFFFFLCLAKKKRITPLTESKHERNVHDESKQRSRGLSEKVDFFFARSSPPRIEPPWFIFCVVCRAPLPPDSDGMMPHLPFHFTNADARPLFVLSYNPWFFCGESIA